jgi:phospholipase A-2-activating protein
LFSSSRDGTARSWVSATAGQSGTGGAGEGDASGGEGWTEGLTFSGAQGHEGFVNAVEWLPGNAGETESGKHELLFSMLSKSPIALRSIADAFSPLPA